MVGQRENGICGAGNDSLWIFFCRWQILIRILEISKNSPTTNRDIVGNWVKNENKKKSPNEIEESTENDG